MRLTRILNWRQWSLVRKAQVTGAMIGVLVTVAFPLLLPLYGEGQYSFLLLWMWLLILLPASSMSYLFGFGAWHMNIGVGPSWFQTSLASLVNALLFALIGTFIGWMGQRAQTKTKK